MALHHYNKIMKDSTTLILMLGAFLFVAWMGFFPKYTSMYELGVKDSQKEAYERGFMVKEITKDDKVVYRWIEKQK